MGRRGRYSFDPEPDVYLPPTYSKQTTRWLERGVRHDLRAPLSMKRKFTTIGKDMSQVFPVAKPPLVVPSRFKVQSGIPTGRSPQSEATDSDYAVKDWTGAFRRWRDFGRHRGSDPGMSGQDFNETMRDWKHKMQPHFNPYRLPDKNIQDKPSYREPVITHPAEDIRTHRRKRRWL